MDPSRETLRLGHRSPRAKLGVTEGAYAELMIVEKWSDAMELLTVMSISVVDEDGLSFRNCYDSLRYDKEEAPPALTL